MKTEELRLFFLLSKADADSSKICKLNNKIKEKKIYFKHGNYANMHIWIDFSSRTDMELARQIIKEALPSAQQSS